MTLVPGIVHMYSGRSSYHILLLFKLDKQMGGNIYQLAISCNKRGIGLTGYVV